MADRRVSVKIDADISPFSRALSTAALEAKAFSKELESADGRMANLVQTGLALAPALVPLGAAAVPAVAGLTVQLGLAAGAAGVAVLAFHGVGDALKALDTFQVSPTAANFAKLQGAMDKLGPAGGEFVLAVDKMKSKFQQFQDVAEVGLLPGVTDGLRDFLVIAPQVKDVIHTISSTLGDLTKEGGAALHGDGFTAFLNYIETTARPVLTQMGHAFGNFLQGFSNVVIAFDPLSRSFSTGLLHLSQSFANSTKDLGENGGFQKFVRYVQESGPKALEALKAIGGAFIQFVEAAAPVGSAVLPVITELADIFSSFADSPVGPLLIGVAASIGVLGRSLALLKAVGLRGDGKSLVGRILDPTKIKEGAAAFGTVTSAADRARLSVKELAAVEERRSKAIRAGIGQAGRTAAVVGGLALATSGYTDQTGLANTATLGLLGSIGGPYGVAVGGAIGFVQDLAASNNDLTDAMKNANAAAKGNSYLAQVDAVKQLDSATKTYLDTLEKAHPSNPFDLKAGLNVRANLAGFADLFTNSGAKGAAALDKQRDALFRLTGTYRTLADMLGQRLPADASPQQIQDFADKVTPALQAAGISVRDLTSKGTYDDFVRAANGIKGYFRAADTASAKSEGVGKALAALADHMQPAISGADALKASLDSLFGVQLSQSQATDAYIKGLKDLEKQLKKTNGVIVGNSDKALANRDLIRSNVQQLEDKVTADAAAGKSGDKLAKTLLDGRDAIIKQAEAAGTKKKDIEAYLHELGLTPKNIETIIKTPGLLTAKQEISALGQLYGLTPKELKTLISQPGMPKSRRAIEELAKKYHLTPKQVRTLLSLKDEATPKARKANDYLDGLDGRTATVTIRAVYRDFVKGTSAAKILQGLPNANGNYFRAFDMGDVVNAHQPMIASPTPQVRIWAEPETQGESYIPHANDFRRPRAKSILEQTAALFGGEVAWRAQGAFTPRPQRSEPVLARRFAHGGFVAPASSSPSAAAIAEAIQVNGRWGIDQHGSAYFGGVARQVVASDNAAQQQASRAAAMNL